MLLDLMATATTASSFTATTTGKALLALFVRPGNLLIAYSSHPYTVSVEVLAAVSSLFQRVSNVDQHCGTCAHICMHPVISSACQHQEVMPF